MPVYDLSSFLLTAEDVLACDLPKLGEILLLHLNSWKDQRKVSQPVGGLNRLYFIQVMEGAERGLGQPRRPGPEYGARQPEVSRRMNEAWSWLVREGLLMQNFDQPLADWFLITREGEELLKRNALYEQLEKLGVDRVKSELNKERPRIGTVGGGSNEKDLIWDWVRRKENKPPSRFGEAGNWTLIADSRLDELRGLASRDFDFKKLIRLCDKLNIAYREGCYFRHGDAYARIARSRATSIGQEELQ
jgi:hypothetical protein